MIDDPELPPEGVIPTGPESARWCVWAPKAKAVELVLDDRRIAMESLPRGFFAAEAPFSGPGLRYSYALDGEEPRPDPLSRFQPDGIHRPSAVFFTDQIDQSGDRDWKGVARADLIVYELHVGTFTPEGTFDAIVPRLDALRDLGITAVELMPVGQFPGSRSWGYDGVFPFAVQQTYGGPEALRRLIGECHRRGLAVFLDVIYNHFGPDGNVFPRFGDYLSEKTQSDWGPAINFDGRGCDPVRRMVLDNARMWVRDFHVDGLRLDAADQIYDRSPRHILSEVAEVAHREAENRGFPVHVFAETDLNDAPRFLHPLDRGGYGLDGHWNDDFHHAAHVVLTGEVDGYYADFASGAPALAKALERVFVNDGNYSKFRGRRHGTPAVEFSGDRFLAFTQNHDQVGNRLKSDRVATSERPSLARLAAGILLLAPRLPLLFMGQEYGETSPFPFFCDFESPELIQAVREGRKREFAHFGWDAEPPDPVASSTRDLAILSWDWSDPVRAGIRRLHSELLRMRREWPTLRDFSHARTRIHHGDVLEVVRGGKDGVAELRIVFNLSGEDRPWPTELAGETPAFRSEVAEFGAEGEAPSSRMRPHEFLIFS